MFVLRCKYNNTFYFDVLDDSIIDVLFLLEETKLKVKQIHLSFFDCKMSIDIPINNKYTTKNYLVGDKFVQLHLYPNTNKLWYCLKYAPKKKNIFKRCWQDVLKELYHIKFGQIPLNRKFLQRLKYSSNECLEYINSYIDNSVSKWCQHLIFAHGKKIHDTPNQSQNVSPCKQHTNCQPTHFEEHSCVWHWEVPNAPISPVTSHANSEHSNGSLSECFEQDIEFEGAPLYSAEELLYRKDLRKPSLAFNICT